jgi:uncharacterized membrane protein
MWDAWLAVSAAVLLSGAGFLFQGELEALIGSRPWIHRLFLAAWTAVLILSIFLRDSVVWRRQGAKSLFERTAVSLKIAPAGWLWIIFLCHWALGWISSVVRFEAFGAGFDMAIFVQAVWNVFNGPFLYSSIKGGICLLGDHFSPILAAYAVPYALWPDPRNLLLMQSLAASLCVFPIYGLAKDRTGDGRRALVFVILYALYLPARNAARFDFHPEMAAMPLLLTAFYCLSRGRSGLFSFLLFLALMTRENAALVCFAAGFYALCFTRHKISGLFWMVFSPLYFWVVIHQVVPALSGGPYFYLRGNFLAWRMLGWGAFLEHLARPAVWTYGFKIFAPVGFASFFDPPSFLLTVPMLVQNLTARNEMAVSIFHQYTALLTPFVFLSAVNGGARWVRGRAGIYYLLACGFLMAGVSDVYLIGRDAGRRTPHMKAVKHYMKAVPAESSVRTHEFFAPHLAHRREIHIYENNHPREGGSQKAMRSDYVVLDRMFLGERADAALRELEGAGYREFFGRDGFMILKRAEGGRGNV